MLLWKGSELASCGLSKPELSSAPHCCPNTCGIIKGDAWTRSSTHPCSTPQQSHVNCGWMLNPRTGGLWFQSVASLLPVYSLPTPSSSSRPLLSLHTSLIRFPHTYLKHFAMRKTQPPCSIPLTGDRPLAQCDAKAGLLP